jgi:predicted dehydrogenase
MKALVVGLGRMGGFHRKVLLDLGYDVDTVDPQRGLRADYRTLVDAGKLYDVAAISCPPEFLAEAAMQLAGVPMLVEKPFALGYEEATELAAALEGAPVCVGFVERFNPHIRALRRWISGLDVTTARFVRLSDRPTWNIDLDLRIHDFDLAYYLGVEDVAGFDTRAESEAKVRRIEIIHRDANGLPRDLIADFIDHAQSPLHALWHAFLSGRDYPKPDDALRALGRVEQATTTLEAVA